jgi:membrane fusion protein, multidrug efflux system
MIAPTIDTRTRTLRVKAQVDNPDGRLRPGLFARVDLGVAVRPDVLMVPEEAILLRSDGEVVFRAVGEDRVQRVSVMTGIHRDGMVEVVTGLTPRDAVVTRGHAHLVDGALVSPRNPDGTPIHTELSAAETAQGVR